MQAKNLPKYSELSHKPILGIDYGEKVTGLATFTPDKDPFALLQGRILMERSSHWIDEVKKVIDLEGIELVVIGIPYFTDGNESGMTRRVKNQAKLLQEAIAPIPLFTQDETLSSVEAKERMQSDPRYNFSVDMKKIDAVAATIIIELFLNKIKLEQ